MWIVLNKNRKKENKANLNIYVSIWILQYKEAESTNRKKIYKNQE